MPDYDEMFDVEIFLKNLDEKENLSYLVDKLEEQNEGLRRKWDRSKRNVPTFCR